MTYIKNGNNKIVALLKLWFADFERAAGRSPACISILCSACIQMSESILCHPKSSPSGVCLCLSCQLSVVEIICFIAFMRSSFNTFAACYLNTQGLYNSCLKSPASTLVDLTFQSYTLRSFSLNQLRYLSL